MFFRAALALTVMLAVPAAAEDVALTFDDLPLLGQQSSLANSAAVTDKLLAALHHHHFLATGFVNEKELEGPDKPQRISLLARWLDAGQDLGNHGYSHLSLTRTPVDAYIADVARGETETRKLLEARGRTIRWFRHPYLETGVTREGRAQFERWLGAHGYRVAPVTMENSDWLFALPYDAAIERGDARHAADIRTAYLAYTARIIPWCRQAPVSNRVSRPC